MAFKKEKSKEAKTYNARPKRTNDGAVNARYTKSKRTTKKNEPDKELIADKTKQARAKEKRSPLRGVHPPQRIRKPQPVRPCAGL